MKHITQKDLQAIYAPVPEEMNQRMEALPAALPERKEPIRVKKKLSAAAVLAAALILMAVGAVAAALNWDAVQYLFTGERDDLSPYRQEVNATAANEWVRASVNSVLYDGYILAFDLTCENLNPEQLLFVQDAHARINGEHCRVSMLDIRNWYTAESPVCSEGGGGFVSAAETGGKPFTVTIRLECMKPKKPVRFTNGESLSYDQQLKDAGYIVARKIKIEHANGEPAVHWCFMDPQDVENFECQRLELSFEVTPPEKNEAVVLTPLQESWETPRFTAQYNKAVRTPLGMYAELAVYPNTPVNSTNEMFELMENGSIQWSERREEQGVCRDILSWTSVEQDEEGHYYQVFYNCWLRGTEELPKDLCLQWRGPNENPVVMEDWKFLLREE